MELEKLYRQRFDSTEQAAKNKLWSTLCKHYFSRYIDKQDTVLDLAAGFCEFINNISCRRKIAVDVNSDIHRYANPDVEIVNASSVDLSMIPRESVDVVFVSNFFEHISKQEILTTLNEGYKTLRKGGRILIMQPNIKYVGGAYWDFFDHHTPLTEKSIKEALELCGFHVNRLIPKFLPYTTKSKIPQFSWLIALYLHFPPAWKIMGKQSLVIAEKR
ncbi:MAG: class I SAM-dependent methyltransferase [Tannerella sp.]|jgi:ubiquinone/menaquinone biosynthesis C-methylase UbiE|nr:class I SAM-dependent methyltransferase [Tannerella sp.]